MVPTVHPFPARMAPELALNALAALPKGSVVLDPMSGSGTVLRQASDLQHRAIGCDMDPLAVLMARVWNTPVRDCEILELYHRIMAVALAVDPGEIHLPWIDDDKETKEFISYWFGAKQIEELRCLAFAIKTQCADLQDSSQRHALDAIKIALSRIIVTKEQCASLARDTSHSRPHRVTLSSEYSVYLGFSRSVNAVRKRLATAPPTAGVEVKQADARNLTLENASVDFVLTSPPYLNAIDYMRGHRMSLVWLGYTIGYLRSIRSDSIGAERAANAGQTVPTEMLTSFGDIEMLPRRYVAMIERYAADLVAMVGEIRRVLTSSGRATFVVGNSCLKGVFIRNADAVVVAARTAGLQMVSSFERDLPTSSRYLPIGSGSPLGKRMRTETILEVGA